MTPTANYTYAMNQVGQIVQNPAFNVNLNTTIFSAGWQSSFNGSNSALYGIYNAYMCNGNFNFIVSFVMLIFLILNKILKFFIFVVIGN